MAREGNAKETIIYVQEGLERLEKTVRDGEQSNQKVVMELMRLLAICCECERFRVQTPSLTSNNFSCHLKAIPRLQLRKRRPAVTLQSLLAHLGIAVDIVAPLAAEDDGRNIIHLVLTMIQDTLPWLYRNTQPDDRHNHTAMVCSSICFSRSIESITFTNRLFSWTCYMSL